MPREFIQELREIAFEIDMLGGTGWILTIPKRATFCGLLAGEGDKQLSLHLFVR